MVEPMTQDWLDQVVEDVVDPAQRIVDPHHHLWPAGQGMAYDFAALAADVHGGHAVEHTVFVECHAAYRHFGPGAPRVGGRDRVRRDGGGTRSRPVDRRNRGPRRPHRRGSSRRGARRARRARPGPVPGRSVTPAPATRIRRRSAIAGRGAEGQYADPAFRAGVAELGRRGLTFDTWHYHHQNTDFAALARAVPDTTMVLDHFGTPLGVGAYAGRRDEIFAEWRDAISGIAKCENVVAKLGGLAMPDNGFGWHRAERPPTSDEFVAQQAPLLPAHDRVLRARTVHVRVELPRRPHVALVRSAVERFQEDRRAILRRRARRDVLRNGPPRVPPRDLTVRDFCSPTDQSSIPGTADSGREGRRPSSGPRRDLVVEDVLHQRRLARLGPDATTPAGCVRRARSRALPRSPASRPAPIPSVVTAGVPSRKPPVYQGPFVSSGTTLRFSVMPAARHAASACRPLRPKPRTSTSTSGCRCRRSRPGHHEKRAHPRACAALSITDAA